MAPPHAYHRDPPRRQYGPGRGRSRSGSRSPSPDPEVVRYLAQQARPASPNSEEHRRQRIAAGGVFNSKSRHEREREETERKQKEEEENAAKAFREFVADMEGPGRVSGGRSRHEARAARYDGARADGPGFVRAGGTEYAPPSRHHAEIGAPSAPRSMRSGAVASGAFGDEEEEDQVEPPPTKREAPGKKKGVMSDFLGELQRNQARREERLRERVTESASVSSLLAQEMQPAAGRPRDEQDAASSNVCVLNLPANVSETSFGEYFSQHGDVASVKIMWPRIEDTVPLPSSVRTTKHAGATGFINYMRRKDAEVAYKEMDGAMWGGSEVRTAWGKSLPKPSRPLHFRSDYERFRGAQDKRTRDERVPRDRKRRSSRSPGSRNHRRTRAASPSPRSVLRQQLFDRPGGGELERTITAVASRVRDYGARFEDMVKERESNNTDYRFLFDHELAEHHYYKTLTDDNFDPVMPAPEFEEGGTAELYSSDTEEDSEWEKLQSKNRLDALGKASRRRLDAMLRGLTLRRERIARVMLFAIEHASAAETVSARLIASILVPTTPLPRKLARLYTVSDILHNSTVSGAWRYRSLFESRLDAVFMHWGDVANSFAGRIKREACKDMARAILSVWETWLVFETARLALWRSHIEQGSGNLSKDNSDLALGMLQERQDEGNTAPTALGADANVPIPQKARKADDDDIDGEEMDFTAAEARSTDPIDIAAKKTQHEVDDDIDGTDVTEPAVLSTKDSTLAAAEEEEDDIDGAPM